MGPTTIDASEIGQRHPVRLWSPPQPQALLLCADGVAVDWWAELLVDVPVALVGIESAGVPPERGQPYEPRRDPRARAYMPEVDPPTFAAHLAYAVGTVLPWAEERLGRSFRRQERFAFGCSNGAVWAASAANLHPELFAGALACSLGAAPAGAPAAGTVFALVAGRFEPGFDRATTAFAWHARSCGARVRLRRRAFGHDSAMWREEFLPALRWALRR
jgi:hypothetical protein